MHINFNSVLVIKQPSRSRINAEQHRNNSNKSLLNIKREQNLIEQPKLFVRVPRVLCFTKHLTIDEQTVLCF